MRLDCLIRAPIPTAFIHELFFCEYSLLVRALRCIGLRYRDLSNLIYPPSMTLQQAFALAQEHQAAGRLAQAESLCRQILAIEPRSAEVLQMLGIIACTQGRNAEGIDWLERAVGVDSTVSAYHANLALALAAEGRIDDAINAYQRALQLCPGPALLYNNYGNALRGAGRMDDALAAYRHAASIASNSLDASNLLWFLHFHPSSNPKLIRDEHVLWNQRFAQPLLHRAIPHANDRSPERRLRLGYVSADFREHPVGRFLAPVMAHHDRAAFEVFCYSDAPRHDSLTRRLSGYANTWRDVARLSDEDLAAVVRQDSIDLLVDLALHSGGSRLLMFARKAAPVQVSWLGYPATTGLSAMDYRLTDPYLDPPGAGDEDYTEQSLRLPHSFWCYEPPVEQTVVNPLPALSRGFITFGCLNNPCKVNDTVLDLWARVMKAVGGSRILFLMPDGSAQSRAREKLAGAGIEPNRIGFIARQPRQQYFETYQQIDVALDTFPYSGHTTTQDSLWMGVPVVSLRGQSAPSRGSLSVLSNVGLSWLVASTKEQFIEIASQICDDLQRMADLRSSLRQRMLQSPLMDAQRFTRDLEAALRQMWRKWCAG